MSCPRRDESLDSEPAIWIGHKRTLECCGRLSRLPVCKQQFAQKLIQWLGGPGRPIFKLHLSRGRNGVTDSCNSGPVLSLSKFDDAIECGREHPGLSEIIFTQRVEPIAIFARRNDSRGTDTVRQLPQRIPRPRDITPARCDKPAREVVNREVTDVSNAGAV